MTEDKPPSPTDRAAKRAFKVAMDEIWEVAHSAHANVLDAENAIQWLAMLHALLQLAESTIAHFDQPVQRVHESAPLTADDVESDAPSLAAAEVNHAAE